MVELILQDFTLCVVLCCVQLDVALQYNISIISSVQLTGVKNNNQKKTPYKLGKIRFMFLTYGALKDANEGSFSMMLQIACRSGTETVGGFR